MENHTKIPEWLSVPQEYSAPRDHDAFLRRSAEGLRYVLSRARRSAYHGGRWSFSPPTKLALTLLTIGFVSAASNFAFVEAVGVALLVMLARYDGSRIARTVALPIQATIFSSLILAPALLWGQTHAFWVVPCKTFVATTALSMLSSTTNWNRFTCAFKTLGAPDSLVFIFDLTLKYVVLLCEICVDTITAAQLRSVGRNRHKARSLGGVIGVGFLHAQDHAREQFDAMTCRCFSGNYRRFTAPWRLADTFGVGLIVLELILFSYLEYVIRCSN
ncbi:MAG: energy-coupling factor transporter transmembrane component T [Planctomycetia bacterium]|nr:energy-coupling factor transporter transmembrane component T [Planctomycetia bacterium]